MPRVSRGRAWLLALACGALAPPPFSAASDRGPAREEPGSASGTAALPGKAPPKLAGARRWACFYGDQLSARAWRSLELAMVDPDGFRVPESSGTPSGTASAAGAVEPGAPPKPLRLAYLSVGEAHESREWWPAVRDKPFVVEPSPEWPGAHRVDLRAEEWRDLLLDKLVPAALARGYDGVMLDTLDVAEHLESSAPARFAGSLDAAASFVAELRARNPGAGIVVNNALPLLERLEASIDGVLVEDLYTRCLPSSETCVRTPRALMLQKEAALRRFAAATGKPVFVLVYAWPSERRSRLVRKALARARRQGFLPYLASPSLERFGVVDPAPER